MLGTMAGGAADSVLAQEPRHQGQIFLLLLLDICIIFK
jgi:hypothetical protein